MSVLVYYEDQCADRPTSYGPHVLALCCVADRIGCTAWDLSPFAEANPCKGDGNLKRELDANARHYRGDIVAVFDNDGVRRVYGLGQSTCKLDVRSTIRDRCARDVGVVFLEQNLDDLVAVCCDALGEPRPVRKLRPRDRDPVFHRLTRHDAAAKRASLLSAPAGLVSFGYLVSVLAMHIEPLWASCATPH